MRIAIIPANESWLNKQNYLNGKWNFDIGIREKFEKAGHEYKIISEYNYKEYHTIDAFIFMNYYEWHNSIYKKILKLNLEQRCIYGIYEPDVVMMWHSKNGLESILKYYNMAFTWNTDLVDNIRVFEYQIPSADNIKIDGSDIDFKDKKLLVNISGNKNSDIPGELYSERKKVIEYFEENSQNDFDLYGTGWESEGYKNYLGCCEDKTEVYHKYKFALCFENSKADNYVTEKIFDCFKAGIVPIYLGGDNTYQRIPYKCYIDYTQFNSCYHMEEFLKNMTEQEYEVYLSETRKFLESKEIVYFKSETAYKQVLYVINKSKERYFRVSFKNKYMMLKRKKVIEIKRFIKHKILKLN